MVVYTQCMSCGITASDEFLDVAEEKAKSPCGIIVMLCQ